MGVANQLVFTQIGTGDPFNFQQPHGSLLTRRWWGVDSKFRFRDSPAWLQARPPACQTEVSDSTKGEEH
jgi:hypothetical protein